MLTNEISYAIMVSQKRETRQNRHITGGGKPKQKIRKRYRNPSVAVR